jgi:hypothetical protein
MADQDWEDRLEVLCRRLSPDPESASTVLPAARRAGPDRTAQLDAALHASRQAEGLADTPASGDGGEGLAGAVAAELRAAAGRLSREQRELLALRGLLELSYDQIGQLLGLEADAVAERVGEARVALRAELRGSAPPRGECPERGRTLRTATRRQDGEPVRDTEEDWLFTHLVGCTDCAQLHAVLLEGATSYASWVA